MQSRRICNYAWKQREGNLSDNERAESLGSPEEDHIKLNTMGAPAGA